MKISTTVAFAFCCAASLASAQQESREQREVRTRQALIAIHSQQVGARKSSNSPRFPKVLGSTESSIRLVRDERLMPVPPAEPSLHDDDLKSKLPTDGPSSEVPTTLAPSANGPQLTANHSDLKSCDHAVSTDSALFGISQRHQNLNCGEACDEEDRCRLFSSHEVLFLRSRISGASSVFNVSPQAQRLIDADYEASVRHSLEYRFSDSIGIRGQFQRYDHSSPFAPPFQPAELGIQTDVADAEIMFHKNLCDWQFSLSGGVEYGALEYSADVATAVIGSGTATFEGVGPVFGLNAIHPLADTGLSFYGSVKAAFLLGSISNEALLINMPRAEIKDETAQRYQAQFGIEWDPDLFENCSLAIRGGWETQTWVNSTLSDDSYGIGSNLTLSGPAVSAVFSY